MRYTFTTVLLTCLLSSLFAQMPTPDGTIQFGNEWIDYGSDYLKISVAEDGLYRVSAADLAAAGMPLNGTNENRYELFNNGSTVSIEVSSEGITFLGRKNRGDLDRFLFEQPESMQLNTRYSLYTDTSTYYLRLNEAGGTNFYDASTPPGTPTSIPSILREEEVIYSEHFSKEYFRSGRSSIYYSRYDEVEGFASRGTSDLLSSDGTTTTEIEFDLPGATGEQAFLETRFGLGFDFHRQLVSADGNLLLTLDTNSWNIHQPILAFQPSTSGSTITFEGTSGARDKATIAWAKVTYPAATTFDDELSSFIVPARNQPSRIELTNLGAAAGAVKAYGATNGVVVSTNASGGIASLVFPPSTTDQEYFLSINGQAAPTTPGQIRFTPTLPTNGQTDYLILTSRRIHGSAVESMANYRRSAAGGGYTVHVVDVEDLYEEYSYGIARHPMALRNYLSQALEFAPGLQYLFLIGKGREYDDIRTEEQLLEADGTYFVPSFGFPASDNLLSAPLGDIVPRLSTGRLSAISDEEVGIYLDKLRGVENQINLGNQTIADRSWMKTIMHLGGGTSPGEQASIRNGLNQLERTVEASTMGANIISFFKTSGEPIEDSRQDAIFETINNGTSVLTFFGHSSSQGFDFSIDNPDNYNNKDRYPFMLSLGCYSGDAFIEGRSISERFIFLRDKGAIALAASKGVGYISALRTFGDSLYQVMGTEMYGQGIGDMMRVNIEKFRNTSNFTIAILLEQFALNGDPAYRMHPRPGPDALVDASSVRFEPDVVPAQNTEFTMDFNLVNIGTSAVQDSINLQFRQQLPDGEIIDLAVRRVPTPDYSTAISVNLPSPGIRAIGTNRIFVTVDQDNEIAELPSPAAEDNNDLVTGNSPGIPLTFIANTAKVAFPPPYAVIGGPVELVSSTTNALSPARNYVLQVSTSSDFAAPLIEETVNSPGGIIRYSPSISFIDSTTYYWRISPDSSSTEGAGFIWSESSFTWLADQPTDQIGWAMQHPGQTIDGEFVNLIGNSQEQIWSFTKTVIDITFTNGIFENINLPRMEVGGGRVNSAFNWRTRHGVNLIVIDSTDFTDWLLCPGDGAFGSETHSGLRFLQDAWAFNTQERASRAGLIDFIENGIEPGKYVMFFTTQRGSDIEYYNEDWLSDSTEVGKTLFDVLEEEGALQARNISSLGSVPYCFAFQKGFGRIGEALALNQEDIITMEASVLANWQEGAWSTGPVGPAGYWQSVDVGLASTEVSEVDSVRVRLFGQPTTGEAEILLRDEELVVPNSLTLNFDLTDIDASLYPTLRADVQFFDEPDRTVPTLKYIYFNYGRPGDVAINPQIAYSAPDSLDQGQDFALTVGYENISPTDMDSLLIELQVINASNELSSFTKRNPPVPAGGAGEVSFTLPTTDYGSDVRLQLRLNPTGDQPENILFNNDLTSRLKIGRDVIDPNLRVYFDGRRINDGELVSAEPEILIQLRDENTFLPLNDTSAYVMELISPNGARERLNFADNRVEFMPATTSENVAEIYFRPTLTEDGNYALTVRAADRNNNQAGRLDFRQEFEVINEQRVANVLTYPNPFTTQTRFVYTLTGSEPPTVFRIQIMTVSGRVVRDINLLEFEDVKIGTHQTEFAWDGTDEYGDNLANGVYLYRVITSDADGSTLKKHDTGTDRFFQNDLGKVVILR